MFHKYPFQLKLWILRIKAFTDTNCYLIFEANTTTSWSSGSSQAVVGGFKMTDYKNMIIDKDQIPCLGKLFLLT